jgi:hypothetical protein
VLVIVKHRDIHAAFEFLFDPESFRRFDILQVDAAECRFKGRDDADQLVRVLLIYFDIEYVDIRKFLEQHALAFHHRLGRQGSDVSQPQHSGAIGNYGHQVASCSDFAYRCRVFLYQFAGGRNARGIRK